MMAINRKRERNMNGAQSAHALAAVTEDEPDAEPIAKSNNAQGSEPTAKRRLVRWTRDEMTAVARAARTIRRNDISLTPLEAVRLAQEQVLAPERRRKFQQNRQIEDITNLMRDMALLEIEEPASVTAADLAADAALLEVADKLIALGAPEPQPNVVKEFDIAQREDEQTTLRRHAATEPVAEGKRTVIRYTADERRTIALESRRLMEAFTDMPRLEAIRKAIEYKLPENRHRTVRTFEHVEWIADEWKAIEREERAEKEAREAREKAEQAERAAEQARAEQARIATEAARAEAQASKAVDPASLPFDTLIGAIGAKVAGMLLHSIGEHLQESIMQRVSEALAHVTVHVPAVLPEGVTRLHAAPRHRKPRVLIVGLLNQQEQDMMKAMGELLALDFVKTEHPNKALEDKARHADLVVLMTKFISHSHTEAVKKFNEHVVFRNGGVSELKRWLTQWINGEVATAAA
jgi:hypothetical protein